MKEIIRIKVCKLCFDAPNEDCLCLYDRVDRVQLDFEECKCCGHIDLGNPADSEYNRNYFKNNK